MNATIWNYYQILDEGNKLVIQRDFNTQEVILIEAKIDTNEVMYQTPIDMKADDIGEMIMVMLQMGIKYEIWGD